MDVSIVFTKIQPTYYRAPHDTERVNIDLEKDQYIPNTPRPWEIGVIRKSVRLKQKALPEVYRFEPFYSLVLTENLQLLWKAINPEISNDKWWSLVGDGLAWCNEGAGHSQAHPKADFVSRKRLDYKPPSFDIIRYCGGAQFKSKWTDEKRIGIETINIYEKLPTPTELLYKKHLWYYGTSISPTGRIQYIMRMGLDGQLKKVRIPLYTSQDVFIKKSELHKTTEWIEPNVIIFKG